MNRRSTLWQRWIAMLLLSYPRDFRRRFGQDLAEQYDRPGSGRGLRAACAVLRDMSTAGIGARLDDYRRRRGLRERTGGRDGLLMDLRHSLRGLGRRPLFTLAVVATLALAAGLNAAVFGILDATLLRPLPFRDQHALVSIGSLWADFDHSGVSLPEFLDYAERNRTLKSIAAYSGASLNSVGSDAPPERLLGTRATASFFEVLGVAPQLGRTFAPGEDEPGADAVAVISHGFWLRRFGADPHVVGRMLQLDSGPRQIVGVMPRGFSFPSIDTELWIPLIVDRANPGERGAHNRSVIARMAPGVSLALVQRDMSAVGRRMAEEFPDSYPEGSGWGVSVRGLRAHLVGDLRRPLQMLMAAVGFVLLIACANVANLMMARASEREHEFATRAALGAPRARLVRQSLLEGAMLGTAGGIAGLLFGTGMLDVLQPVLPEGLPLPGRLVTDARVAGFALAISSCAGAAAAIATGMRAARMQPASALRGARSSSDPVTQRLRALLTVAEIALAVMLLVAGGVALRSFSALVGVDPGVRIAEVATARVTPSVSRYREDPHVIGFYERAIATLSAMPDVAHAGAVSLLPLSGMTSDWGFGVEGYVAPTPALEPDEQARVVGGRYFQALGIPLRAGRFFEARDTASAPPVAIVSELVAKKYWGDATPIGRRIRRWGLDSQEPWTTVIGIVGDIRNHGPGSDPVPMIYFPVTQIAEPTMTLVARMQPGSTRGLAAIAEAVRRVDPQQPLFATRTMEDWMARTVAAPRFNLVLLTLFATLAITLAAVGVYGVMAFTVNRRTRELGIRLALGARPASLMQLVLRQSLTLAGAGVAMGLSAGLVAATAIESQFYGARVFDPLVIVVVPAIVLGVALLASYLPARRAMHVDPVVALRAE